MLSAGLAVYSCRYHAYENELYWYELNSTRRFVLFRNLRKRLAGDRPPKTRPGVRGKRACDRYRFHIRSLSLLRAVCLAAEQRRYCAIMNCSLLLLSLFIMRRPSCEAAPFSMCTRVWCCWYVERIRLGMRFNRFVSLMFACRADVSFLSRFYQRFYRTEVVVLWAHAPSLSDVWGQVALTRPVVSDWTCVVWTCCYIAVPLLAEERLKISIPPGNQHRRASSRILEDCFKH